MNDADQVLAAFHPQASGLFFRQLRAFGAASRAIDRGRYEERYQLLCRLHVQQLRSSLQAEATSVLQDHQRSAQLGAISLQLRHLIQDYIHDFVRRSG